MIEDNNFIGNVYPQNCGDSLLIVEKTQQKNNSGVFYYRGIFQKYPYEILALKSNIINGVVLNPQIEQVEFIDKLWPQKCGDVLKIIEKSNQKQGNKYLWKCEFQKYPFIILAQKQKIVEGNVNNPQIEQKEFVEKVWLQNCGSTLKILEKTNKKRNTANFYKCIFIESKKEILALKADILNGSVIDPKIEEDFCNSIWKQNCGDSIYLLKKTNKKKEGINDYLYEGEFIGYPGKKVYARKNHIKEGVVDNPYSPLNCKETFLEILKSFNKKPTILEVSQKIFAHPTTIGRKIKEFNLQSFINYDFHFSYLENEVKEYIQNLNIDVIQSEWGILKNKEIDIFIPSKKIGFEFNGLYWHSNVYKSDNYHQEKSLEAKKNGIRLIHIWEWDWLLKQQIIKSLIKSSLGIFNKVIGARQCELKELDNKSYQDFCNENHLQGEAGAKVKLGLYYQNELVQIVSFGSPRFTDKYNWEIIRECSKLGYKIIGGKQKLWNYFTKNYNPINCISYCDFSKFTGNSYLQLGFVKERLNKPGFVWWDEKTHEIFWRSPQNHQEYKQRYLKIYDAGQLVFTWQKERK